MCVFSQERSDGLTVTVLFGMYSFGHFCKVGCHVSAYDVGFQNVPFNITALVF